MVKNYIYIYCQLTCKKGRKSLNYLKNLNNKMLCQKHKLYNFCCYKGNKKYLETYQQLEIEILI